MRSRRKSWGWGLVLGAVSIGGLWSAGDPWIGSWLRAATAQRAASPTRSSPIAITSDDQFVWSVNPDNNSVSVFNAALDPVQKVAEVPVGIEPWCVAITPNNAKVYVTNMVSGTVSVINATTRAVIKTIPVGTEPFGCALSPDGKKLYVANQSSDDVSLINTATDIVTKTIRPVGPKPHGIAVSADGTKVYVTQFLSQSPKADETRPLTQTEGADDGRVGRVTVLDGVGDRPIRVVTLKPFDVARSSSRTGTRWRANRSTAAVFNNPTKAFPNLLESILIRGNSAYVIGTCSSPNGPFRFNVNVQSCVSTIDTTQDVEIKTVNMNDGVNFEPRREALQHQSVRARVQAVGRRGIRGGGRDEPSPARVARWPGRPDHQRAAAPLTRATPAPSSGSSFAIQTIRPTWPMRKISSAARIRAASSSTPRDTRAFVMDFLSRDVAVVDISGADPTQYKTLARMPRRRCRGRAPRTRSFSAASTSSTPPSGRSARPTTPGAPRG